MSDISFPKAMQIAQDGPDEPSLRTEFRAAVVLQDVLEKLFLDHTPTYQGFTTLKIQHDLITLVSRHHLSDSLREGIRMALEMTLGDFQEDEQFLADVKYWDTLSQGKRAAVCDVVLQTFAKHVKHYTFFRLSNEPPRIELCNGYVEMPYVDIHGNPKVFHPTVKSTPHYGKDCQHVIEINTHKQTRFNDPYYLLPEVMGAYISLTICDLQHICRDYRTHPHIYESDLQMLKVMENEGAVMKPFLDAVRSQQFSTRFISEIKTSASQSLVHAVETADIPERRVTSLGGRIKAALGVLGL